MSKRLASVFLAYGVLAGLIAPAGLLAQDEATPPHQAQAPPATTTTTPATTPTTTPAPPPPAPAPQPTQQQGATTPAPAPPQPAEPPKPAADPAPVAVASGPGSVTIKDFSFGPAAVTVNAGDTVTWTNTGPSDHTATASDGSFDTGTLSKGRSGSHTFSKAGTFAYVCSIHPNMHGTVKVVASSSGGGGGGGGSSNSGGSSGSTSSPSRSSTSAAPSGSSGSLPSTGVDAGGLALVGAGFLALGLFARRRTA